MSEPKEVALGQIPTLIERIRNRIEELGKEVAVFADKTDSVMTPQEPINGDGEGKTSQPTTEPSKLLRDLNTIERSVIQIIEYVARYHQRVQL